MSEDINEKPIFIPKVQDSNIAKTSLELPFALMEAHNIEWRPNVINDISNNFKHLIVDPVTHLIPFKLASEKTNYRKLPYANLDEDRLFSDATYRYENLIKPSLNYQIDKHAAFLIAPYFCAEDIHSSKFNITLTMISDTIQIAQKEGFDKPIFGVICIDDQALADTKSVNFIVERYSDSPMAEHLDGYLIIINRLDDRKADESILMGLANLTFQLSQKKAVFIKHIGAFGEVLCAIGARGFINALAEGECFSTDNLQNAEKQGFGRDHKQWTYVDELYGYVNIAEIKSGRVTVNCDCPVCSNSISDCSEEGLKKLHFLFAKEKSLHLLGSLNPDKRPDYILTKIKKAEKLVSQYTAKGSKLDINYLQRWARVLEATRYWEIDQDDKKLDAILQELEND